MLQCGVRFEISLLTTQCVSCLIKDVECMFGIVWPPPNFQHVALSNMQPTCWIIQHLSFDRALREWENHQNWINFVLSLISVSIISEY